MAPPRAAGRAGRRQRACLFQIVYRDDVLGGKPRLHGLRDGRLWWTALSRDEIANDRNWGATVPLWTERGDPLNAGQEEGCQEGDQEEEVSAPGKKGGWMITPRFSLVRDLTASIAGRALRTA